MNSEERINYIVSWIKNYCNSVKFQPITLVIGVSGGIDSAVTSALCAKTGLRTIAVSMPIRQKFNQHNLSLCHLKWLEKNKTIKVIEYCSILNRNYPYKKNLTQHF